MSDSSITKNALAAAMKKLMTKYPMEKIKISDIVKLCDLNRQSFYYHFKDKYDLVNWIFYTEFFENIESSLEDPIWNLIEKICEFFYENRAFYSNALKVKGQNSFSEYFIEILHPIVYSQLEEIFKDDPNENFYATFFTDAIRVSITRWLLEGSKQSPHEFVELIKTACTGIAYKLIEENENKHSIIKKAKDI